MTDICAICHEDLSDNLYQLPECSHTYHTNCIMHWFRTKHTTCPLCQNQGINYTQAYYEVNNSQHYGERALWKEYYKQAASHARKKDADKEIARKVKAIKKTMEKDKEARKMFKNWKKLPPDNLTNKDVIQKAHKMRRGKWRFRRNLYKRKAAVGYLYFHKFLKNKIIIAEKVQIS